MTNTGTTIHDLKKETKYSIGWLRETIRKAGKELPSIAEKNSKAKDVHELARYNMREVTKIKSLLSRVPKALKMKKVAKGKK